MAWKYENNYKYSVNGPGAVSGSLFQQELIEGLEKQGVSVDLVSDYPYSDNKNYSQRTESHSANSDDFVIKKRKGKCYQYFLKGLYIKRAAKEKLQLSQYDFAVAYLVHTPYLQGLNEVYKAGIPTVLICPDLPDMMDMSLKEKHLKRYLKKIDYVIQHKLLKRVNAYVLFTEYMKERLPVADKPYIVIEGVASFIGLSTDKVEKKNAVMHAGTLHKNIGIEQLLESFRYVKDPLLELWIFGTGELTSTICEAANNDNRIKYFGFVDRQKLFEYEKSAKALINVRDPKSSFTRYSFPSKTFEYMYSGTPLITTWLEGMPNEYRDYIIELEDNKPESISHVLNNLDSYSLDVIGDDARNFVFVNKNKDVQAKKLLQFLSTLRGR